MSAQSANQSKNKIVVLSDLHIADDTPTVWYQSSVHNPYLEAICNWIVANAASIRELVLLGDVVDLAVADHLERLDGVGQRHGGTGDIGELLGHVGVLAQELLDPARAGDDDLVLLAQLVHAEDRAPAHAGQQRLRVPVVRSAQRDDPSCPEQDKSRPSTRKKADNPRQ